MKNSPQQNLNVSVYGPLPMSELPPDDFARAELATFLTTPAESLAEVQAPYFAADAAEQGTDLLSPTTQAAILQNPELVKTAVVEHLPSSAVADAELNMALGKQIPEKLRARSGVVDEHRVALGAIYRVAVSQHAERAGSNVIPEEVRIRHALEDKISRDTQASMRRSGFANESSTAPLSQGIDSDTMTRHRNPGATGNNRWGQAKSVIQYNGVLTGGSPKNALRKGGSG
jgi:hypothetical protein